MASPGFPWNEDDTEELDVPGPNEAKEVIYSARNSLVAARMLLSRLIPDDHGDRHTILMQCIDADIDAMTDYMSAYSIGKK